MSLIPANQAQLVRSSQKDEHYRSLIKNSANEAFQSFAGESLTRSVFRPQEYCYSQIRFHV